MRPNDRLEFKTKKHDSGIMNCIILQLVVDSTMDILSTKKNKKNNIYLDMWKKSRTFALDF